MRVPLAEARKVFHIYCVHFGSFSSVNDAGLSCCVHFGSFSSVNDAGLSYCVQFGSFSSVNDAKALFACSLRPKRRWIS